MIGLALAIGLLAAADGAGAQEPDSAAGPPTFDVVDGPEPRSFLEYTGLFYIPVDQSDPDVLIGMGMKRLWGGGGAWMTRASLEAGISMWGTVQDAGTLLGGEVGLGRALRGDYLEISPELPVQLYGTVGAGLYWTSNLRETAGERAWMPEVTAGIGLRIWNRQDASAPLVTLELLQRERIGVWPARVVLRVGIYSPRGL